MGVTLINEDKFHYLKYEKKDFNLNYSKISSNKKCVVVGFGPSGMFSALALARMGLNPIIIEQGKPVEDREKDIKDFFENRKLNKYSNVQFGEGGAGTFSDGKLNTNLNNDYCKMVITELYNHGAPKEITYLNKPHIGSDNLKVVELTNRVTTLYRKNLGSLRYLDEVILPTTLTSIADGSFYSSQSPVCVRFLNPTPITISTSVFSDIKTAVIAVPIESYYTYYNTTNYLASGNVMVGFQQFNAGDTLPATISGIAVTWYPRPYDAKYTMNEVTSCTEDCELFARFNQ